MTPKAKKTATYAAGVLLLVAFAGFSLASFRDALTPYVSYGEAVRAEGRTVQVAGGLVAGSSDYDEATGVLSFTLTELEGEGADAGAGAGRGTIRVAYDGLKPANFEEAISIVAIGRWSAAESVFHAEKLLVKCPSKYQGAEVKEYG